MKIFDAVRKYMNIPRGMYCYRPMKVDFQNRRLPIKRCRYFSRKDNVAYCELMNVKDDVLLNDYCKICGVKE